MQISRIASLDDFDAKEWDSLVTRSISGTVYQSYNWQKAWWQVFGDGYEPLILEARTESGELVGIAPLVIQKSTVHFLGPGAITYADFIVTEPHEEILGAFIGWLDDHSHLWSALQFKSILDTSPTVDALPRLIGEKGYPVAARPTLEAPLLEYGIDPEAEKGLANKRDTRKRLNRLKREGEVSFSRLHDANEILAALPTFYEQHIRRRQGETSAHPSEFLEPKYRTFLETLIQRLAPIGRLGLDVLWLDEKAIAYGFFLIDVDPQCHILAWPSFDMDYADFSPGNILLKYELEASMEEGIRELDFGDGEFSYKYRYANRIRTINSVFAFSHPLPYYVLRLKWGVKAGLQQFRRKYPRFTLQLKRTALRFRNPSTFEEPSLD
jgi:CelD/BcsL family acetyltransferase involved in cellulose biosynthesis